MDNMKSIIKAVLILGLIIGHFWHKYFTDIGANRLSDFSTYAKQHWPFWVIGGLGLLILFIQFLQGRIVKKGGEDAGQDSNTQPPQSPAAPGQPGEGQE